MSWILRRVLPDRQHSKTILKIASPVMAAMLTQTFINQFDTILVGYLPKEHSIAGQAGLGYAVLLHWLVGGFVGAISVGTQAMAARRLGEGDRFGAGKVVFNSSMIALFVGSAVTILAAVFARPLFALFTDNPQVLAEGVPYTRARFLGILAMVGTLSFKSFFDGLGKTHYHLITAIIMNVFNGVLAYLFVFGKLGFPALGVLGAGVGALIASYVGLFIMVGWALRAKYRVDYGIFRPRNFDWNVIGRIVRLSLPSGVATVFVMTGFLLFFKWVSILDAEAGAHPDALESARISWLHAMAPFAITRESFSAVIQSSSPVYEAATKVIVDILFLSIMACMGLGIATATLVSQNLGAGRPDEAERYGWESVKIAAWFAGAIGMISLLFPDQVMGIFTQDYETIEVGRTPLRILSAGQFLVGFGLVLAQALFGAGATRFVMVVEIVLHMFVLVPLSYVLAIPLGLRLNGIFLAGLLYIAGLAALMTWKFKSGTWKGIRI